MAARRGARGSTNAAASLAADEYRAAAELRAGLRRFLRRSEQVMRAHGLTPERYELLLAIKAEAHADTASGPTISQLAETLELAHSSTTQLVRRAENHGLVKREVAPQDARIRYLRLTRKGEEQLAAATTALRPDRAQLAKASRQFTTQC